MFLPIEPSDVFLKFSQPNTKLKKLAKTEFARPWLEPTASRGKRKVYSLDLLSGWTCPFAVDCKAKVYVLENMKKKLRDDPRAKFRCFSATEEVAFPTVYNLRNRNLQALRRLKTAEEMADALQAAMPADAGIIRIHVGGDFFAPEYFDAWIILAKRRPDVLFYAYTKSIPYWVARIDDLPDNLSMTASRGGSRDDLIDEYGLKEAEVIYDPDHANGREIDHDDSHAANKSQGSFALLLHGQQPAGSEASKALKSMKERGIEFAYSAR